MRRRKAYGLILAATLFVLPTSAYAADYTFKTDGAQEYYQPTSYADIYDSQYNYGAPNVVDYQTPSLEYGIFSPTQTGFMEKTPLPGLQQIIAAGNGAGSAAALPGVSNSGVLLPSSPFFTELTEDFLLSNGAIGRISIPDIGVQNYYLWQGATADSMSKGLGHFSNTSVWDGNVGICGHNRGAKYIIGAIKNLDAGAKIIYTTSEGTRIYVVKTVTKIRSDAWGYLESTTDNRITLITCVAGDDSQRWCVQAVEMDS